MRITQSKNGNFLIQDKNQNNIAVVPFLFVFKHPRVENSVLINTSGNPYDEKKSFQTSLEKGVYLNEKKVTKLDDLLNRFNDEVNLSGTISETTASTPVQDTIADKWKEITDWETMYTFAKIFNSHTFPIQRDNKGKITKEDYLIQSPTMIGRIVLTYYYHANDPTKINYIRMSGFTKNIDLTVKTFNLDSQNKLFHTYEITTWQRADGITTQAKSQSQNQN